MAQCNIRRFGAFAARVGVLDYVNKSRLILESDIIIVMRVIVVKFGVNERYGDYIAG